MSNQKTTLQLNISERINALSVLNSFKGNLDKLAIVLDDIKGFPVTDEEWALAERTTEPLADGNVQWRWNDEKGGLKSIEVDKVTVEYLKQVINEKNEKGDFGLSDKPFITLLEKLS